MFGKPFRFRCPGAVNRLPLETSARIIGFLVEGNGLRDVARLAGCSVVAITKLLIDVGTAAAAYHRATVRDLRARRIRRDKIWPFVGVQATADGRAAYLNAVDGGVRPGRGLRYLAQDLWGSAGRRSALLQPGAVHRLRHENNRQPRSDARSY